MRRIIALTVVVLGVAVLGSAQTRLMSSGGTLTVEQTTPKAFSAINRETASDGKVLMRGDVRIKIGDAEIRADEADLDGGTREVTLRGNVRILLPPAPSQSTR